jgi:hypothetical protein
MQRSNSYSNLAVSSCDKQIQFRIKQKTLVKEIPNSIDSLYGVHLFKMKSIFKVQEAIAGTIFHQRYIKTLLLESMVLHTFIKGRVKHFHHNTNPV